MRKKIKKYKIFKILFIIFLILTLSLLAVAIPLHISEIIAMRECANTPGCMYCVPIKTLLAIMMYTISFGLFVISMIFFIIFKVQKKKYFPMNN